jgi:hypothetical protein
VPNSGLNFRGLNLVSPVNRLAAGFATVAVNLRAYFAGGVTFRNLLTNAIYTLGAAVHTLRRLNDQTPNAPPSGFSIINGAGTVLSAWNSTIGVKNVATGLSGNPESMVPFRPNASVQPWCYVADSAAQGSVTLHTQYLGANASGPSGTPVDFVSNGMMKVSCNDGYTGTPTPTAVCWKMGIQEPALAPDIATSNSIVPFGEGGVGNLLATAIPWTNYLGQNTGGSTPYNYGEALGYPHPVLGRDGTAPFIIDVQNATTVTITALALDGTVVINGTTIASDAALAVADPSRVVAGAPGYPGQFIQVIGTPGFATAASYIVGAFTDGSGTVVPAGVAPLYIPSVVDVGVAFATSTPIPVPFGAVDFQVGVNSLGDHYTLGTPPINSGLITFQGTVTTNALPSVVSILGSLSLGYFDDSPTSGPVSAYIWKNADDPGGSGPVRSISDAIGTTAGNSFIFDCSFGASAVPPLAPGIPGLPGIGWDGVPMLWTTLSPESAVTGSNPIFAAPLIRTRPTNTLFANFNFCLTGNIYFPAAGQYTFVLTNHDSIIWGIGGGVTAVSATTSGSGEGGTATISDYGQTITVVGGYPLLPRESYTHGDAGHYGRATVVISVPAAGIYPIEVDYDYWGTGNTSATNIGRILLIMATPNAGPATGPNIPTIIPPLPSNVRQETQYRYVYRSSATGATSNPSPESTAETIPVAANTITSLWSNDPQVDVVDYYRIDSTVANFTYVATGPNDDLGTVPGTNTPISDSLTDTELGTQLLDYDNFEPFPSIDLPQKGVCSVSGGVITWVSGGAIGGTFTGFNIRWLAGTEILIGSPTSLVYTFIARPTSGTSVTIPGVPDGTNLAYEIPEPILAAQPLPYMWGPTDNINFAYAVGDPLRPGTLYWCKGSNLDSAPDTNQQDVTDPSEALVNGAIAGGLGVLFSIKRAWLILPSFANAVSTATGTTGSTWTLQESSITRGLYIPRCVCVSGGGLIFFRVDDGIHISSYGSASKSITDDSLYPIFSHENEDSAGNQPVAITREGMTIYPPDDTLPQLQRFSFQNGYMYYDYQGIDGFPHTLVFDEAAMGWVWDISTPPATIHAANEGPSQQGVLVGCSDFSVRQMASNGTEVITGTVMSPAIGGRGYNHVGIMVIEYSSTSTVTLNMYPADEGNGSYGPPTITLPSTSGQLTKYWFRPGANKYKLAWFQFSSGVSFVLNFQGCIAFQKSWGSSAAYDEIPIFGGAGGEG